MGSTSADRDRRDFNQRVVDEAYGGTGCTAHRDHRELLARDDLDAVVIATPDHWHAAIALDAMKAGKDVYCEKPLTLDLAEARALVEAARSLPRVFQTGSQHRSGGTLRQAAELVRAGGLGRVRRITVGVGAPSKWCDLGEEEPPPGLDWDRWLGPAPLRPYHSALSPRGVHDYTPTWRRYREYSGGDVTDRGAHFFDIALWMLGSDASGPIQTLPGLGVILKHAGGAELVHGDPRGLTVEGERGLMHAAQGVLTAAPGSLLEDLPAESAPHVPPITKHLRNWLDCVRTRQRPISDVEAGARAVTACHLVNLTYWLGRPLRWDPDRWQLLDDEEANRWRARPRRPGYELPLF